MVTQRAEIKRNPRTKRYRVRYIGNNNEVLAVSETINTLRNAKKNVVAMMKLFGVREIKQRNFIKVL